MIPNVTRGDRMQGLMAYLFGAGRHEEHANPHLVAGDEVLMATHAPGDDMRAEAQATAAHLDCPRSAYQARVKQGHVWHCSLSIGTEDGELTDEQWGTIANEFVEGMQFDSEDAPVRWAAVRHGVSRNGNDHIHIAVDLVREDGTVAKTFRDYQRAQAVSRAIEERHGLQRIDTESPSRGWKRGEHREGGWLSTRDRLELSVRSAAVASTTEAEFVSNLRESGLLCRPRWDESSTRVTGYSVAVKPHPRSANQREYFYGGKRLSPDLSLPALRRSWRPDPANAGAHAWANEATHGERVDPASIEPSLAQISRQLSETPLDDRAAWADIAHRSAGALAAWSRSVPTARVPMLRAAKILSKTAGARHHHARMTVLRNDGGGDGPDPWTTVAKIGYVAARRGSPGSDLLLLIVQVLRVAQAMHAASLARDQRNHASAIAADARRQLDGVRQSLYASQNPTNASTTTRGLVPPSGDQSPSTVAPRPIQPPQSPRPAPDVGR